MGYFPFSMPLAVRAQRLVPMFAAFFLFRLRNCDSEILLGCGSEKILFDSGYQLNLNGLLLVLSFAMCLLLILLFLFPVSAIICNVSAAIPVIPIVY